MSGLFDDTHPVVRPAEPLLDAEVSPRLWLGTSSWSFPGWQGVVYGDAHDGRTLSREGLRAYARHPMLRAVGIDRSFYAPVPRKDYAAYARQVPDDFRFLVKATQPLCSPLLDGRHNPAFLDVARARQEWVQPAVEGLGDKLGVLLLQLVPQPARDFGAFAERLDRFLGAFAGLPLAVEVRTPELLTPDYARALVNNGARHCYNVWNGMPGVPEQMRLVKGGARHGLVVRWMLRPGLQYVAAKEAFAPFSSLAAPDPGARADIAHLVRLALARDKDVVVIANNKAEGCSPRSLQQLAALLAEGG